MIFGINTTSDVSKLLYVISRAVRRVKFETILKYHVQIMLLFVYTTTRKRFVIFTCRYFKLGWNTTALSQSNCRNFSCGSIIRITVWIASSVSQRSQWRKKTNRRIIWTSAFFRIWSISRGFFIERRFFSSEIRIRRMRSFIYFLACLWMVIITNLYVTLKLIYSWKAERKCPSYYENVAFSLLIAFTNLSLV